MHALPGLSIRQVVHVHRLLFYLPTQQLNSDERREKSGRPSRWFSIINPIWFRENELNGAEPGAVDPDRCSGDTSASENCGRIALIGRWKRHVRIGFETVSSDVRVRVKRRRVKQKSNSHQPIVKYTTQLRGNYRAGRQELISYFSSTTWFPNKSAVGNNVT